MNRLLHVGALSFALAGLAACSTSGSVARAPSPPAPGTLTADEAYIAQVEQIARRRGIEVQWVNVPSKRIAANPE